MTPCRETIRENTTVRGKLKVYSLFTVYIYVNILPILQHMVFLLENGESAETKAPS